MLKPKPVFCLGWLRTFIRMMVFLIIVLTHYLIHIFWKFVLTITWIVVIIRSCVNQVYIYGRAFNYYIIWLLIILIILDFIRVLTRKFSACFLQNSRLTVSRLSIMFFFQKFEDFFFFIKPLALLIINIYFSNICRGLEYSLELSFDSFIKYFVLEI